jgi:DNA-binding MarR family transcriptional regulator
MTARTRWLTADEQRTWRLFLAACESLFAGIDGQLMRDSGLPHGYYEILVHLSEAPGRSLRMSQLATASTYSKSRLSHAVSRLEERGWVLRIDCPTDRRGQIAQLTDEGFAVLEAAAPGHVEQVRKSLIDALTPSQVRQLEQISVAICGAAGTQGAGKNVTCGGTVASEAELDSCEIADAEAELGPCETAGAQAELGPCETAGAEAELGCRETAG